MLRSKGKAALNQAVQALARRVAPVLVAAQALHPHLAQVRLRALHQALLKVPALASLPVALILPHRPQVPQTVQVPQAVQAPQRAQVPQRAPAILSLTAALIKSTTNSVKWLPC